VHDLWLTTHIEAFMVLLLKDHLGIAIFFFRFFDVCIFVCVITWSI